MTQAASILCSVTLSGAVYTATMDACVGVPAVSATAATPAGALELARLEMQANIAAYAAAQGQPLTAATLPTLDTKLRAAEALALATYLTPAPTLPTPPLYGTDVSTFAGPEQDLDPFFAPITGAQAVAEVIARRLQTPQGYFAWDPAFGLDLTSYLSRGLTPAQVSAMGPQIATQVEQDERILAASATATLDAATQTLAVIVNFTLASGPFVLVLNVDQVAANISALGSA